MDIQRGCHQYEVFTDEVSEALDARFVIEAESEVLDRKVVRVTPGKHWVVHVVQLSHHDLGYTDLPSGVLAVHDRSLDDAIDMAESNENRPPEERFRIVLEQAWSVDHFLRHARPERREALISLMRQGDFELTALFGNMNTELCGHETLYRCLYHTAALGEKYHIGITSAEHNDVPGFSWGLSRALTDAGIRIFCPGLPQYYSWGTLKMQSFWDEEKIFGRKAPGAFWWEAPGGKRILFWCNNAGCGGDAHPEMPRLEDHLARYEEAGYPYDVIRWPVSGGARDNSPYTDGYVRTIERWNRKWAYPRLISSTNTLFYKDFIRKVPADLPVFRGELPGHDYPVGAMSTAAETALNRNNHYALLQAEKLAAAAAACTDYVYPWEALSQANTEALLYNEHTWGYHFPSGPAAAASQAEKAVHARLAAARAHEVASKAMAGIADHIARNHGGASIVVFNTAPSEKTGVVRAPMREFDNAGSEMRPAEDESGSFLRGFLLNDRWHVNLPEEFLDSKFRLIHAGTGECVPYQLIPIESEMEPVPYAAQRVGIGRGSRRYGFFEKPAGHGIDLCFIARDVPVCGYSTYHLIPEKEAPRFENPLICGGHWIENEFYRIGVDRRTYGISSFYDKEAGRELIDSECPHSFHTLVVRRDYEAEGRGMRADGFRIRESGPVCACIEITGQAQGHPAIMQTVCLYAGVKQVFLNTRILKDATTLLNAHIAFPFLLAKPVFRYEGALAVMDPIRDYLPGSYSDTISVQNWVKINEKNFSVLWASLDSPVVGMGGLWRDYISPAHRCLVDERMIHPPMTDADIKNAWLYSMAFHNNFGTNFSVSQCGEALFRYVITTANEPVTDARSAAFGWAAQTPFVQILTKSCSPDSRLPVSGSFVRSDNDSLMLFTCKMAEDTGGLMLRIWNVSDRRECGRVSCALPVRRAASYDATERTRIAELPLTEDGFEVRMDANEVMTVLVGM